MENPVLNITKNPCYDEIVQNRKTTKGEENDMFKKFGTVAVLSAAILFGGAFSASADAQTNVKENVQYEIHYSINGKQGTLEGEEAHKLIQKVFDKLSDNGKLDWMNIQEESNDNQSNEKQPNEEGSAKEESNEQENTNTEQPATDEETEEQSAEEQPVKEEKPQEAEQPEAPAPSEPTKAEEQPEEEQEQSEQLSAFEQEVVELTNAERAKQGLAPLEIDEELSQVAREKSSDMATNNYFSHNSPTYGSPFDMMNQFGISYQAAGENIAQGQTSPQQVVDAWMNSDGHRANILNGDYTHIGVGFVENGNHWTQMFIGK